MLAQAPQTRVLLFTVMNGCTQWCPLYAASCFVPTCRGKSYLSPNSDSLENTYVKIFFTPERQPKTKFRFVSEALHWKRAKCLKSSFVLVRR